jgi:hypothetical protein
MVKFGSQLWFIYLPMFPYLLGSTYVLNTLQCPNRIVQSGITIKLQIFLTDTKGLGLQTLEKISRGTFVCEYAGEIISLHEAKNRTKSQTEYEMNSVIITVLTFATKKFLFKIIHVASRTRNIL